MCVSASSDGTIRFWSLKTSECVNCVRIAGDIDVNTVLLVPKSDNQFVICNQSNTVSIINNRGQVKILISASK